MGGAIVSVQIRFGVSMRVEREVSIWGAGKVSINMGLLGKPTRIPDEFTMSFIYSFVF